MAEEGKPGSINMTAQKQLIFWAIALATLIALLTILGSVLFPFVLGMVVAYLLNPLVLELSKFGIQRKYAVILILATFALVVAAACFATFPVIYRETLDLAQNMPVYMNAFWEKLEPLVQKLRDLTGQQDLSQAQDFITKQADSATGIAGQVFLGVVAGGQVAIHFFSVLFIAPIVAYFIMKEWPFITNWVKDLLPLEHKKTILDLFHQIDRKLAGFIRGQLSVMLVLGIGYALALTFAGLKYGALIGLVAGLLSVIPLVGSAVGFVIGVMAAFFQSGGDWSFVALIGGIFIIGQLIEGNLLAPWLVGTSIGLHPLWIFFALMVGGALFGILGMLLAVPLAAVIGVLLSFGIKQYKASRLYKGKK